MPVFNGEDANQTTFNTSFMDREADTDTVGKVDLLNADNDSITDVQRMLSEFSDLLEIANKTSADANANVFTTNYRLVNGGTRKDQLENFDAAFEGAGGHNHDGSDGQGSQVSANNLSDFNSLFAEFQENTFDAASGTSIDVSSLFTGDSSGGDSVTEGVITSAPNNYVSILEKDTGGEIEDGEGDRVFARITEAAGVWTLSFFTNESGTETAHSLTSQDIRFLYREVFSAADRPTIGANVGVYDTQSAVGDIPDATPTQRGLVSTGAQSYAGVKDFTSRPTINSNDVVDINQAQVVTNKDIDGGTASNTSRITLPKDTTVNLDLLTDKEATVAYDTTLNEPVYNNGSGWNQFASDFSFTTVTRNVTSTLAITGEDNIVGNPSAGDITYNLPTASGNNGLTYKISKINTNGDNITIDPSGSETIGGFATYVLYGVSDIIIFCDGTNWQFAKYPDRQTAFVKDVQVAGTSSGTFNSGSYQTRVLNTLSGNSDFASLSANQVTLQPGTYTVEGEVPAFAVNYHKPKLRNVTDSTDTILGGIGFSDTTGVNNSHAPIFGEFTITSAKAFELQHRCTATRVANGFGLTPSPNFGDSEVFAQLRITKVR